MAQAQEVAITSASWTGVARARYDSYTTSLDLSGLSNAQSDEGGGGISIYSGLNKAEGLGTARWGTNVVGNTTTVFGEAYTHADYTLDGASSPSLSASTTLATEFDFTAITAFQTDFLTSGGPSQLGRRNNSGGIDWIRSFIGDGKSWHTTFEAGDYVWHSGVQQSVVSTIVGNDDDRALTQFQFNVNAPVPEPGSVLPLCAGCAGLLLRRRRQRKFA